MSVWRPAKRIEVVPPVRDLARAEREHGDIPVGVPAPGTQHDDWLCCSLIHDHGSDVSGSMSLTVIPLCKTLIWWTSFKSI